MFGMRTGVSPRRIETRNISLTIKQYNQSPTSSLRKEVIQPHLPIRLPCYDFTPVISPAFGRSFPLLRTSRSVPFLSRSPRVVFLWMHANKFACPRSLSAPGVRSRTSGVTDSHGVTGGVYKTRERIHRDILIRDY